MRSFVICTHQVYFLGDQIKKIEIGGACSTYGGAERSIQVSGGETGGKETIWKTQAWMGIILKWILKWDGGMDWIDLPQDRDRWRLL